MNSRVTTILLLALLISGGATYVVYRALVGKAHSPSRVETVQVIMASRDLAIGTIIKDTDLKTAPWAGSLPKGMFVKKEAVTSRGVIAPIWEGEPVMDNRLAATGGGGGLAATIRSGMRAVAVRVNDFVAVAGFVVPGMRVDVLISGVPPGAQATTGPKVKTLLQNIEVLSAGQNYQRDAEGKPVVVPVVNLLVTPEQAEVLSLASNETRIQLVLRNPLDMGSVKTPGMVMSALFGDVTPPGVPRARVAPAAVKSAAVKMAAVKAAQPEPPKLAAPDPGYRMEILIGAKRAETKFPGPTEDGPRPGGTLQ